jgi:hypothetical protein
MGLLDVAQLEVRTSRGIRWSLVTLPDAASADRPVTVNMVASHVMWHRLSNSPRYYGAWTRAVTAGTLIPARDAHALRAFISPGFGVPERPSPVDHLHGIVAEHLWHMVEADHPGRGDLVHQSPPKFDPSDHGGDGLVIRGPAPLRFRLWEVKKRALGSLSPTLRNAYSQLNTRGLEYVAQYVGIAKHDPIVRPFLEEMVDLWVDGDPRAGAGVAVGSGSAPRNAFGAMPNYLTRFRDRASLTGVVIFVDDYAGFCNDVRSLVWTGL